ncbi:hypothetical protein ABZW11_26415 [Nonomuraea sp. NPDC004580]|uniref:hypothetical protein n=1 Tax=Nonomuraea sp. NPDC004580 TaxID=3154552 RepID=UPI0033B0C2E7
MIVLLCMAACAAAVVAALAGYLLNPTYRKRRAQRRRWAALRAHRQRVAGQLARDPAMWERWWDERLAQGLDDEADVLRGSGDPS